MQAEGTISMTRKQNKWDAYSLFVANTKCSTTARRSTAGGSELWAIGQIQFPLNNFCCSARSNVKTLTTATRGLHAKPHQRRMPHMRHAGVADPRSDLPQRILGAIVRVFMRIPGGTAEAVCTGDTFNWHSGLQFGDCSSTVMHTDKECGIFFTNA